jgi:hypothetical protein
MALKKKEKDKKEKKSRKTICPGYRSKAFHKHSVAAHPKNATKRRKRAERLEGVRATRETKGSL